MTPLRLLALAGVLALACGLQQNGEAPIDAGSRDASSGGSLPVGGSGGQTPSGGSAGSDGSVGGSSEAGDCNCLAAPPVGWEGPVAFHLGSGAVPDCPAAYPTRKFETAGDIEIPAASCQTCTCSTSGVSCPDPTVTIATDTNCTDISGSQAVGSCSNISSALDQRSARLTYAQATAPCTPVSSGAASIPKVVFTQSAAICGGAVFAKTCSGGVCAPQPTADFPSLCIYTGGTEVSCPPEYPDDNPKFITVDYVDNRTCSACACNPPLCASTLTISDYCGGPDFTTATANGQCVSFSSQGYLGAAAAKQPPSCTATGGALTGEVNTILITLCCAAAQPR